MDDNTHQVNLEVGSEAWLQNFRDLTRNMDNIRCAQMDQVMNGSVTHTEGELIEISRQDPNNNMRKMFNIVEDNGNQRRLINMINHLKLLDTEYGYLDLDDYIYFAFGHDVAHIDSYYEKACDHLVFIGGLAFKDRVISKIDENVNITDFYSLENKKLIVVYYCLYLTCSGAIPIDQFISKWFEVWKEKKPQLKLFDQCTDFFVKLFLNSFFPNLLTCVDLFKISSGSSLFSQKIDKSLIGFDIETEYLRDFSVKDNLRMYFLIFGLNITKDSVKELLNFVLHNRESLSISHSLTPYHEEIVFDVFKNVSLLLKTYQFKLPSYSEKKKILYIIKEEKFLMLIRIVFTSIFIVSFLSSIELLSWLNFIPLLISITIFALFGLFIDKYLYQRTATIIEKNNSGCLARWFWFMNFLKKRHNGNCYTFLTNLYGSPHIEIIKDRLEGCVESYIFCAETDVEGYQFTNCGYNFWFSLFTKKMIEGTTLTNQYVRCSFFDIEFLSGGFEYFDKSDFINVVIESVRIHHDSDISFDKYWRHDLKQHRWNKIQSNIKNMASLEGFSFRLHKHQRFDKDFTFFKKIFLETKNEYLNPSDVLKSMKLESVCTNIVEYKMKKSLISEETVTVVSEHIPMKYPLSRLRTYRKTTMGTRKSLLKGMFPSANDAGIEYMFKELNTYTNSLDSEFQGWFFQNEDYFVKENKIKNTHLKLNEVKVKLKEPIVKTVKLKMVADINISNFKAIAEKIFPVSKIKINTNHNVALQRIRKSAILKSRMARDDKLLRSWARCASDLNLKGFFFNKYGFEITNSHNFVRKRLRKKEKIKKNKKNRKIWEKLESILVKVNNLLDPGIEPTGRLRFSDDFNGRSILSVFKNRVCKYNVSGLIKSIHSRHLYRSAFKTDKRPTFENYKSLKKEIKRIDVQMTLL